jgi:hypothetical protein
MLFGLLQKNSQRRREDAFLSEVALGQKSNKTHIFKKFLTLFAVCFLLGGVLSSTVSAQSGFDDPGTRNRGGGGDLVPVDPDVDGGEIKIGTTSQVVVLFRNDSGRPVETSAIQLYPSSTISGVVSLNQCSQEPLPASAVCAIALSVKGLQSGPWRIDMLMRHSGRSRLVTASLTGNVEVTDDAVGQFLSDIEAIPSELDFGDTDTSQPVIKGVVLRNSTSNSIDINSIYIEAADQSGYSLRTDCDRLEAGQACIVTVKWSPVLKGLASGVLLVEHTGPTSVASINLDGDYAPESVEEADVFPEAVPGKGLLVSSQEEVDFGSNIESLSTITVSLVNVGDAPITLQDISLAGQDTGLSLGGSGCVPETVLEPIEACPLIVSWSPSREGTILDDIQILHDGARGVLVLPVRGEADGVVSQDSRAVRLAGRNTASLAIDGEDSIEEGDLVVVRDDNIDPTSVLDGFVITSHSPTRAIISGPGGSRIVFNGEDVVLGGFLWKVNIRSSGIEFASGPDRALLLFDRSLSSLNRSGSQSSSGSSSSGSGSSNTAESN